MRPLPRTDFGLHETSMLLDIANEEAQELKWALDIRLVEMRRELVKSSDHAYRDDLKNSLVRLEHVARRLDEQLGGENATAEKNAAHAK